MAIIDYFSAAVALDQNGRVIRDAEADVYALGDTSFTTPLAITDPSGVPMAKLRSNSDGIYPEFRVVSGAQQIIAKSGDRTTPMTSLGVIAKAAEDARDEAQAAADEIGSAVGTVQTARDQAVTARDQAVAVGNTNDTIMASRINDPASASRQALNTAIGDVAGQSTGDRIQYVSKDGDDANSGLTPGLAKLTVAAAIAALPTGGLINVAAGVYTESAWGTPPNDLQIRGAGYTTVINFVTPNATLLTLVNSTRVRLRDMRLALSAAATGSILVDISNSFRCSFTGVSFTGQHTAAATTTFRTQIGVRLRDNAGDNRFTDCDFNNFGHAVRTDTIQNYFANCVFGSSWRTIIGGDPANVNYVAGISLTNCTLVASSAAVTDRHIFIEGTSNTWWFENVWIEGAKDAVVIGNAGGGPAACGLVNMKIAGTETCVQILGARQPTLTNISFAADGGQTPTELTIDPAVTSGVASNLVSAAGFEVPLSRFPNGWTYIPRSNTESSRVAGRNLDIGAGIAAGQNSYFQAGNRARFGYDGTNVVVSDQGGGREVKLRAGAAPLDAVRASGTGVGFNGSAPIAKPTISGSRGGNAALASLLTALASQGLITDSTSA